jgi:hypothetical protein
MPNDPSMPDELPPGWRRDAGKARGAAPGGAVPVKLRMDPFSANGAPGPLGKELLAKFAGMSIALARPVSLEDVMDGLRPRWAVGALARCVVAGWIESCGVGPGLCEAEGAERFAVTEIGWEMRDGKRTA